VLYNRHMSLDQQVLEVLSWMALNCADRPLTQGEIKRILNRWDSFTTTEKQSGWERCFRRFRAAKPTLAIKDRVKHAGEAVQMLDLVVA